MAILSEQVRQQLRARLDERLNGEVDLTVYVKPGSGRLILPSGLGCPTCADTQALVEEVTEIAPDHLKTTIVDVTQSPTPDADDVPIITVAPRGGEARIRFQGLPAGYEFASFVDALERVSSQEHDLSEQSVEWLNRLEEPLNLMVFTTPT
jgi:alkyl hydroperoxide reductase subunit AhpF